MLTHIHTVVLTVLFNVNIYQLQRCSTHAYIFNLIHRQLVMLYAAAAATAVFFGNFKWLKIRKRGPKCSRVLCACVCICVRVFLLFFVWREQWNEEEASGPSQPSETHTHLVCGAFKFVCAFCTQETKDQITTFICNLEGALFGISEFGSVEKKNNYNDDDDADDNNRKRRRKTNEKKRERDIKFLF